MYAIIQTDGQMENRNLRLTLAFRDAIGDATVHVFPFMCFIFSITPILLKTNLYKICSLPQLTEIVKKIPSRNSIELKNQIE